MSPVEEAADRLIRAARTRIPCPPVRDLVEPGDVRTAYAVQQRFVAELFGDEAPVGRKIGLTSTAVQQQLGVDQPDFGVLFAGLEVADGTTVPGDRFLQPRAEGEIAFRLRSDLVGDHLTLEDVVAAVDAAAPAIEICDSRITGWDITFVDTVADNASAGGYVLGAWQEPDVARPRDATMTLTATGMEALVGQGSACLGGPYEAVLWLARQAASVGDPLRAGQFVLSGALAPMVDLTPGRWITVDIAGLGSVSVAREGETS